MQRIQVLLHEEQFAALKQLANFSGIAQSELIRQGIDLLLNRNNKQRAPDWKQATRQVYGIWQDHTDLADTQQQIRQALNTRMARRYHE